MPPAVVKKGQSEIKNWIEKTKSVNEHFQWFGDASYF